MVLELGIGIIAICLPSIWMVVISKAPEAFLRSVDSLVSLASLGSRHSKRSQDHLPSKTLQSNASNSSHVPISGPSSADAYEMNSRHANNLESVTEGPAAEGQIHVSRSVEQTSESNNKGEEV